MLQTLWKTFLSGLATVVPIAATVYFVVWLSQTAEAFFGALARSLLPEGWYLPGLGVALAVGLVLLVGTFLNAWLFSYLLGLGERVLERIPLIKTVYTGIRDILNFVSRDSGEESLRQVVLVEIQDDVHVVGFVTDPRPDEVIPQLSRHGDERIVAVYLAMGYQVGGYTLYLPESRVRPLDMPVEEALRMVLTAGINRPRT